MTRYSTISRHAQERTMRFCLRCDNVRWMGRVVDARERGGRSITDKRWRRSSGHGTLKWPDNGIDDWACFGSSLLIFNRVSESGRSGWLKNNRCW